LRCRWRGVVSIDTVRSVAKRRRSCGHGLGTSAGEAFAERLYAYDIAEHAALDPSCCPYARMSSMAAGGPWSECLLMALTGGAGRP
jgi:hypothetical protein